MERKLSLGHIVKIATFLPRWRFVGRGLGLSEVQLDDLERRYLGHEELRGELLSKWVSAKGPKATYGVLIGLLEELEETDASQKVRLLLERPSGECGGDIKACGNASNNHDQRSAVAARHEPTESLSLDSEPTLQLLEDKVVTEIPNMYESVGIQLGLKLSEIHVLRPAYPSLEETRRAYRAIFDLWRKNGSPPYTWRTIIDVLKTVGEKRLSTNVASWIECNK